MDPCYLGCGPTKKYLIQTLVTLFLFDLLSYELRLEPADGGLLSFPEPDQLGLQVVGIGRLD